MPFSSSLPVFQFFIRLGIENEMIGRTWFSDFVFFCSPSPLKTTAKETYKNDVWLFWVRTCTKKMNKNHTFIFLGRVFRSGQQKTWASACSLGSTVCCMTLTNWAKKSIGYVKGKKVKRSFFHDSYFFSFLFWMGVKNPQSSISRMRSRDSLMRRSLDQTYFDNKCQP